MTVTEVRVGDVLALDVGAVAHGGVCVARHSGQVVFVRGALPGERVIAEVTDAPRHGRFVRARTMDVLTASPDRVTPPCPYAGNCGGCDWQHARLAYQRELKAHVVREQLVRLAQEPHERWSGLEVRAVPGDREGLAWRTRMRYAVAADGRAGLRRYRSHEVVPIDRCALAVDAIDELHVTQREWPGTQEVLAVRGSDGPAVALADPRAGMARVREEAAGRAWRLDATAFWQVHPGAADALVATVRAGLDPQAGDHVVDLYAGAGLFAGGMADDVGPGGRIDAVESDDVAMRGARRSLHDCPQVHLHHERVESWLESTALRRCDLVVVDPPRAGLGAANVRAVLALAPRAVAYVACDPAAMARDIGTAKRDGWELASLTAFDLFPMTHHVECVAILTPPDEDPAVTVSA